MKILNVYILSDSIGETGELIAKAALRQFELDDFTIKRFPYHSNLELIEVVLSEAARSKNSLVIYTSVEENIRNYIQRRSKELDLRIVDVMGPPMDIIEEISGLKPLREPGLIRRLDENYFKKVESIEFAVTYDDGKDPRGARNADICLVGISRTSKTPLSIYLANKLYKVANIPLVPEVPVPKELYKKDSRRIIGLIANPYKINAIREERLQTLGLSNTASYSQLKRIEEELEYSKRIMEELDCLVIDVTNKAIEETAGIIVDHMRKTFGE